VDSDVDRKMLQAAVAEHPKNHHLFEELRRVTFRDDRLGAYSFDYLSPSSFREKAVATRVPICNLGGWFEVSEASAAINRFHSVPNPGSRLTLGPWTHQRVEISPGRSSYPRTRRRSVVSVKATSVANSRSEAGSGTGFAVPASSTRNAVG
jgi:predicted acyl esterase